MRFSISTSSRRIYYITSKVYFIFSDPRLNEFSEYRDCGTFGRIGRSTHTIRNKRVANRRLIKKKFHNPGLHLRVSVPRCKPIKNPSLAIFTPLSYHRTAGTLRRGDNLTVSQLEVIQAGYIDMRQIYREARSRAAEDLALRKVA